MVEGYLIPFHDFYLSLELKMIYSIEFGCEFLRSNYWIVRGLKDERITYLKQGIKERRKHQELVMQKKGIAVEFLIKKI